MTIKANLSASTAAGLLLALLLLQLTSLDRRLARAAALQHQPGAINALEPAQELESNEISAPYFTDHHRGQQQQRRQVLAKKARLSIQLESINRERSSKAAADIISAPVEQVQEQAEEPRPSMTSTSTMRPSPSPSPMSSGVESGNESLEGTLRLLQRRFVEQVIKQRVVDQDHLIMEKWLVDNINDLHRELKQTELDFEHYALVTKKLLASNQLEQRNEQLKRQLALQTSLPLSIPLHVRAAPVERAHQTGQHQRVTHDLSHHRQQQQQQPHHHHRERSHHLAKMLLGPDRDRLAERR